MSTITQEVVKTETTDEPGDAAHIVMVPPHLRAKTTPQAYVMQARVEGLPVQAVCGHVWVPQRDPEPLPVCEPCLHLYRTQGSDLGDRGGKPDA